MVLGDTAGHLRIWVTPEHSSNASWLALGHGSDASMGQLFTQSGIWRAHERAVTSMQHVEMADGLLLTASQACTQFQCSMFHTLAQACMHAYPDSADLILFLPFPFLMHSHIAHECVGHKLDAIAMRRTCLRHCGQCQAPVSGFLVSTHGIWMTAARGQIT